MDAFFQAAHEGEFDALIAVLDPDVVLRADFGPQRPAALADVHGAAAVAGQALIGARPASDLHPALVNGAAGAVITVRGRPFAVLGFTVVDGKIVEIDALTSWLDFARYRLPPRAKAPVRGVGTLLLAAALWLFWRAHRDLGTNWSTTCDNSVSLLDTLLHGRRSPVSPPGRPLRSRQPTG